ncbi:MAG: glycyl-radical enzyme activating protein [Ruminococcaceae bacterium]|nr:glycyl-radical enzyme activating protein [Oscillospiraceae bacterium]
MLGTVFNIQRFSLFDGPGVRTVVFLKGCPLRCIWCHNPEGIKREPQIMFNSQRCIACGECVDTCPRHRHFIREGLHGFIREGCEGCGKCTKVCPTEAVSLAGKLMDTEAVMAEVMRDASLYKESGGGVTLSGGEPLYQGEFAVSVLKAAKDQGISTCIETCGHAKRDIIVEAAKYTDDFYFDYKATGDEMHKKLCGVPQTIILENLALLCELGARVTLRCPIVEGENEFPEHIRGIGEVAGKYSCIGEVHLEPYHRLGVSKSEKLGENAAYDGKAPDRVRLESYCEEITRISGKACRIS